MNSRRAREKGMETSCCWGGKFERKRGREGEREGGREETEKTWLE